MAFALGIGLTNECNLACAHCYRPTDQLLRLSLADVGAILDSVEVGSVNLGTGENVLHPRYHEIIAYLRERGVKLAITSNGYSVMQADDDELRAFHSVELSIDFATRERQDAFRGPGNWDLVMTSIDRCVALGIRCSVLAVMMATNYDQMAAIARIAARHGAAFRVNVYQPVKTDRFTLSYEQFWTGFRLLFAETRVVACSEPLVNAIAGLDTVSGCPCGTSSIRVTPRGEVTPCPYWGGEALAIADLQRLGGAVVDSPAFAATRLVPDACRGCRFVETCGGGCASRRLLRGDLNQPDEYCPVVRGETIDLVAAAAPPQDLPKARNVCCVAVTVA